MNMLQSRPEEPGPGAEADRKHGESGKYRLCGG